MSTATPNLRASLRRIPWQHTFSALRHYNYRLWFAGQLVSLVGTWMQNTAQSYLIYELTRSNQMVGLVGFASGLPTIFFMLYGGAIADRVSRRVMMTITQAAMMVLALILGALAFTHLVQPWHIIVLAFLLGIANAFDAPARLALVAELVEREDMANAIALNATMFNLAVVIGPSVAGLAYNLVGPGWCFTLNGISFIAVIVALAFMHLKPVVAPPRRGSTVAQIKEGIKYTLHDRRILALTISIGVFSMFGLSMMTLLPAWSTDILHGDSETYGILLSSRGFGAVVGALIVASLARMSVKGRLWSSGTLVLPLVTVGFALSRSLPLSLLFIAGAGWAFMTLSNSSNALVQTNIPDELRGRVMSIYSLVFFGAMPLGSLLAGSLANIIGETTTILISAGVLAAFAGVIWLVLPQVRRMA